VSDTQPKQAETADLADHGPTSEIAIPVRFPCLGAATAAIPAAHIPYHPVCGLWRECGEIRNPGGRPGEVAAARSRARFALVAVINGAGTLAEDGGWLGTL
jgi:hypothetical protein